MPTRVRLNRQQEAFRFVATIDTDHYLHWVSFYEVMFAKFIEEVPFVRSLVAFEKYRDGGCLAR
jgi:hypothetical protein